MTVYLDTYSPATAAIVACCLYGGDWRALAESMLAEPKTE